MLFKIGEFARIANLSIHQLRHYDEVNLFKPAVIDPETGYRYYQLDQLPRLHRIVALKNLGLTLEQVRRLLADAVSAGDIRGMLLLKKAQVEQTIADEIDRLHQIEARLQQIEAEGSPPTYTVVVKSVPEQQFLSSRHVTLPDDTLAQMQMELFTILQSRESKSPFPLAVIHDNQAEDGRHNVEVGYAVQNAYPDGVTLSNGVVMTTRTLAAAEVATTLYSGARREVGQAYAAIFGWIDANHYQMGEENIREVYFKATRTDSEPHNLVELQIPIVKAR